MGNLIHTPTPQEEQAAAARMAESRRLHEAATLAAFRARAKPMLRFRMGSGRNAVEVVGEWPGVLSLFDVTTGRMLAQSVPGQPYELAAWNTPNGLQRHASAIDGALL